MAEQDGIGGAAPADDLGDLKVKRGGGVLIPIIFVVALPRKLDGGLAVPFGKTTVHLTEDTTELELTAIAAVEFDERLEFLDCFLHVPCGHGNDVPAAFDGRFGFAFPHSMTPFSLHSHSTSTGTIWTRSSKLWPPSFHPISKI